MIIAISIILAGILVYVILTYNKFVRWKNGVEEAFSTMDVYLKKRWDLVPNLVNIVKGYAEHEKITLEDITKLRNGIYSDLPINEKIKNISEMEKGITRLIALSENYPELKANQNFIQLSEELSSIESDIANSRKYFNAVVKELNNGVQIFPNNIVATLFGIKQVDMYEISNEERTNVKVEF